MRRFIERALAKLDKMDHTAIRRLVRDIASENERLEAVLGSMLDGVVVTDKSSRILLYNKSSERMMPFMAGELHEKAIWEAISDQEIAAFFREKLEAQEMVHEREFALEDNRIISCSIMPLVRDGTIQGNLLRIEDVTEKRGKEARLRRAENLASLTTLAAGVAHEIKNPLTSIGIHIQLIQKELKGKRSIRTEDVGKYLDIVNEEVDRLNMIVVDFLFAVRPMDTKLVIQDVNQLIKELVDFLKFELEEAKITLLLELGNVPGIEFDEKYMKQALLNLVKNAIAAMPDGGELKVQSSRESDSVLLSVSDTGFGISEENLGKIFEPYFTTKDFSSGLGLTLVFKIMKEHRGEIAVRSKKGEGTTFTLSFPIPQSEKKLIDFIGDES